MKSVGEDYFLTLNGGAASTEEFEALDGAKLARQLIASGTGVLTPYGVVFDNGMEFKQEYTGGVFPGCLYEPKALSVELYSPSEGYEPTFLSLPMPKEQLERMMERGGFAEGDEFSIRFGPELPSQGIVDVLTAKKTGYNEVTPGQSAQYTLTGIANNSNVSLGSFFWRDILPVQAVRLDKIVTGTWNARGNYKLVYRTNYSGETWRTLSDNLSTFHNYVLDASPSALGLAAGECVTEFMFSFGTVPANFRQAEPAKVQCVTLEGLANGTQFTNQADAGGVWDGQWIMAASRWTTKIYAPSVTLPRTGY